MSNYGLRKATQNLRRKGPFVRGLLGDFDHNIEVAGRPGYYYVRIERPSGYEIGIFRGRVRALYNLPVIIETNPLTTIQYITGVDDEMITYGGSDPLLVPVLDRHADTHGWQGDDMPVWLHTQQIFPLRVQPHTTNGKYVVVMPGTYYAEGEVCTLSNSLVADLTAYFPPGGIVYVSLCLDATGAAFIVDEGATTLVDAPEPPAGLYWSAVIMLRASSGVVEWQDIIDARWFGMTGTLVNPMTTLGDLITALVDGFPRRLGIGSEGQVLTVVDGAPAWTDAGSGSFFFRVDGILMDDLTVTLIESPVEVV